MLGNFLSQSFDAEDLGGVVAAGVEIEPELLRHVEMVLAQFAGDEGIDVVGFELVDGALPAASEDRDALGLFAAVFDGLVSVGEECLEFGGEFVPSAFRACCDCGDIVALIVDETADVAEPEGLSE